MEALPEVDFDPLKADQLGDMLVANVFFIGCSWLKAKLVYPDANIWMGTQLLFQNGEFVKLKPYLRRS